MMTINRHNYEEYFLLLADSELSEQERNIVEDFVRQNPDLEEELTVIKLAISKADDNCKLDDKSFLMKQTNSFINAANFQEIILMYYDEELNADEKKETETFLSKNPSLKSEFDLLKRIKLEPDHSVIFPYKKLLLKKERNDKVVYIKWWKIAAAAILLGIGIWTGNDWLHSKKARPRVSMEDNTAVNLKKTAPIIAQKKQYNLKDIPADNRAALNAMKHKERNKANAGKPSLKANLQLVKNKSQLNNLPQNKLTPENKKEEETYVEAKPLEVNDEIALVKKGSETEDFSKKITGKKDIVSTENDVTQEAIPTSYTLDENEKSNNYAFYNVTQERFNKSKLGGFLRKVKRVIERKISPLNAAKDHQEIAVN